MAGAEDLAGVSEYVYYDAVDGSTDVCSGGPGYLVVVAG